MSDARPGLAVERTVLAWTRTWLSVGACGLLLTRMSLGSPPRVAAALTIGAVALALTTLAGRRRATVLRAVAARPRPLPAPARATALTSGIVTLFGVGAAVLVALR